MYCRIANLTETCFNFFALIACASHGIAVKVYQYPYNSNMDNLVQLYVMYFYHELKMTNLFDLQGFLQQVGELLSNFSIIKIQNFWVIQYLKSKDCPAPLIIAMHKVAELLVQTLIYDRSYHVYEVKVSSFVHNLPLQIVKFA